VKNNLQCHSRESGNPGTSIKQRRWMPVFTGMTIFGVCALLLFIASAVHASDNRWPGVDETVVEKYAAEHGRPAKPGLINLEGDALLFAFLLAGTAGGFVAGYYYRDQFSTKSRMAGKI
jgi:cobalt/nickel transport protein